MSSVSINKIDEILTDIDYYLKKFLDELPSLKNKKEFSEYLSKYFTILIWSKIDNFISNIDVFKDLFSNFKYSSFNQGWFELFVDYFALNNNNFKFQINNINKNNQAISDFSFLQKISINSKEKITEADINFIYNFFNEFCRIKNNFVDNELSYLFIKIFFIDWNNSFEYSTSADINKVDQIIKVTNIHNEFSNLKVIRNQVAHSEEVDKSISNLDNWNYIYWYRFKKILEQIKKVIVEKKFLLNFEKYHKSKSIKK